MAEVCKSELECKVSAKRMWYAALVDGHNCLPKAVPHAISHVTYDGKGFSKGSLRTLHFHKSFAEKAAKENKLDYVVTEATEEFVEVDTNAFKVTAKLVKGGSLGTLVKQYHQTVHIEGKPDADTCVVHWSDEFEALSEEHKVNFSSYIKEKVAIGLKALETYLLTHDDYKEV